MKQLLINFFYTVLYQPLFNILVLLYEYLPGHDFGIAVIVLTIIIRLILYPSMVQSLKSQKTLSEIQPKLQEIQEKYKNDKEKQSKELMALYQKEKVNPFGGCLPLLIQLPILIALYRVFIKGLRQETMQYLYSFVPNPGVINAVSLGIIDLSKSFITSVDQVRVYYFPALVLAILAGVVQFIQSKMMMPKATVKSKDKMAQTSEMMQKQMLYIFPALTVFILVGLPSAVGLYWTISSLFSVWQQYLINKQFATVKNNQQ